MFVPGSLAKVRPFLSVLILLLVFTAILSATDTVIPVRGTVSDPSGAVIPGAKVSARNLSSGSTAEATTGPEGSYSISLAPGQYDITYSVTGFEQTTRQAVNVTGESVALDVQLQMAAQNESLSVTVEVPTIDTQNTQLGETITAEKMQSVPLNGRSYTDLLAMQPGVIPASSAQPNAVVMSGCTATPPSGDLDPGNLSVSGQRETSNGFAVNSSNVEEDFNNGTAVVPNLDSIQDFKVLTSTFDAEYGNYSGGQVLVNTKSGGNKLHGSAFEFLRNTNLDARNYFATDRAAYRRNQYGGTLGGAIRKDKAFFFLDYQGTRMTQGQETGSIGVPSLAERGGDFNDLTVNGVNPFDSMQVSGTELASRLTSKLGRTVNAGDYYSKVFPNYKIDPSIWPSPAQHLLQYIPTPTDTVYNTFSNSTQNEVLGDDKAAARIDLNTRWGNLSGYYFIDQYNLDNPYPTAQGGANVPGFNAISNGRAQLFSISLSKAYGANTVNEAHFSYMRAANVIGHPQGGVGPSLASQGFTECSGTDSSCLGIVPLNKSIEGIENVAFNDFTIGVDVTGERQTNNTFQWSDSLTHIIGHHTLKFGGSFHLDQVNILSNSINNGSFVFNGTETGVDFADFLLGVASTYEQGDAAGFYLRNKYIGAFAQDSWQVHSGLVLNYGVRWDVLPPWHEKYNQIQTFVLGQQSAVYPGAPKGLVFPGDSGVPSTLSPTKWTNFSPRIGISYSPNGGTEGLFGKIFGPTGKSSIHAGFGIFYSAFEGLSAGIMSACAPYGYDYDTIGGHPMLDEPFVTANGPTKQPFPSPMPTLGASASHPNSMSFDKYEPITGDPAFYYRNTSPYTESYNLSFEREVARNTTMKLAYVGSQAHHLLVLVSADPGNAAICLSVHDSTQVASGSATCGPFSEGGTFTRTDGTQVQARGPFDANYFDGITYQKTIGFSNYNAFEATLRHTSPKFDVLAGYTYGKSLDDSSSLSEPVYPMSASMSKAISAFDLRHNFVVSYRYLLPFEKLVGKNNRLTSGWTVSGITRFSTGLPVTLYNNTDSSLLGSMPNGINNNGVDTPIMLAGDLQLNRNPRKSLAGFNATLFPQSTQGGNHGTDYLGQLGNVPRRFFYGPGMANFDMALQKEIPLREARMLQFRVEAFNIFNHAQFFGAAAVNGNVSSSNFGNIMNAMPPRQVQLAAKFMF